MTKAEILALPLDKLNGLVAEKVMGECYHQHWNDKNQDHIECQKCGQDRFYHQESQEFVSNITAAWRVQQKMAEQGYKILVARLSGGDWASHFMHGTELQVVPVATNQPSASEAICRAALLAIEGRE